MFGFDVKFGSMSGFNPRTKKGSISNGDWDRDGVKNKKDCKPFDYKKQDTCASCGESFSKYEMVKRNGKMYCPSCDRDDYMENKFDQVLRW